jgi:hypothetical protein
VTLVVKVSVGEEAFNAIYKVVSVIRADPTKNKHTATVVENFGIAMRHFNQSYFIDSIKRLGVSESTIKAVEKATGMAESIQAKMLTRAFSRFSSEQLLHIANMAEQRAPVQIDGEYYLLVPLEQKSKQLSDKLIDQIRNEAPQADSVDTLTALSTEMLKSIIDFNFIVPLKEMDASVYFITIVRWASKLWLAMNAHEMRKLGNALTPEQLQIYADIIEEEVTNEDVY